MRAPNLDPHAREELLRRYQEQGRARERAEEFGLSEWAVRYLTRSAGVRSPRQHKLTEQQRRKLLRRYRKHGNAVARAHEFGLTPASVRHIAQRAGVPSPRQKQAR